MFHTRRVLATSIAILIGTALMNLSGSASASAPQVKPIDDTFSFKVEDICSFPIRVRTHITGTEIVFTDRQGNPSIDVNHLFVYGIWKNPLTGKTVIER